MPHRHLELHRMENVSWLRAAVLGANDGIVSTSSLLLGVAASHASHESILIAGAAALVSGAMSMATGEYISVQSQADAEQAALHEEKMELSENPRSELQELAAIYIARGVDAALAKQVAAQLMTHDALGAHARDELGITDTLSAKPLQAAGSSALSFSVGALLPVAVAWLAPHQQVIASVALASLILLALLGGLAARAGGASIVKGMTRVTLWSALAMGATSAIGALLGVVA